MKKIVNGLEVDMTPAEVTARQAEDDAWSQRHIPTPDETDQDEINRTLTMDGSVVRAGLELLFGVMSGKIAIDPNLTKPKFITLLKGRMRTP